MRETRLQKPSLLLSDGGFADYPLSYPCNLLQQIILASCFLGNPLLCKHFGGKGRCLCSSPMKVSLPLRFGGICHADFRGFDTRRNIRTYASCSTGRPADGTNAPARVGLGVFERKDLNLRQDALRRPLYHLSYVPSFIRQGFAPCMGEVIRYRQVFLSTLCVIDIAYCVYLFRHG